MQTCQQGVQQKRGGTVMTSSSSVRMVAAGFKSHPFVTSVSVIMLGFVVLATFT